MRRRHGSNREAADTGLNTWSHLTNCRRTYEAATAWRGIAAVLGLSFYLRPSTDALRITLLQLANLRPREAKNP